MIPILVAGLVQKGLSILANAVMAKGQQVIEDKLGVKLDKEIQSPEGLLTLKRLEIEHEEFLVNASIREKELEASSEKVAQENVSSRWEADMSSDSWMSKNIRPMTLIYLTTTFTLFMLLDGYTEFKPDDVYMQLLGELLKLVFGAYFVGRTVVQGIEMWKKGGEK